MLSKQGYLNAGVKGPWLPHVMFFVPEIDPKALGSDLGGDVPMDAHEEKIGRYTTVDVPVSNWSDGTSASEAFKKYFGPADSTAMAHKMDVFVIEAEPPAALGIFAVTFHVELAVID